MVTCVVVSNPHEAQRLDIMASAAGAGAPLKAHRDLDVQCYAPKPVSHVAELLADDGHRSATMNAVVRHNRGIRVGVETGQEVTANAMDAREEMAAEVAEIEDQQVVFDPLAELEHRLQA